MWILSSQGTDMTAYFWIGFGVFPGNYGLASSDAMICLARVLLRKRGPNGVFI